MECVFLVVLAVGMEK